MMEREPMFEPQRYERLSMREATGQSETNSSFRKGDKISWLYKKKDKQMGWVERSLFFFYPVKSSWFMTMMERVQSKTRAGMWDYCGKLMDYRNRRPGCI